MASEEPPDVADSFQYDSETRTYRATFDSRETTPSMAVVELLAAVCETPPTELDRLHASIDPDALDAVLVSNPPGRREGDCSVQFTFNDHEVTIRSCGLVKATPLTGEG